MRTGDSLAHQLEAAATRLLMTGRYTRHGIVWSFDGVPVSFGNAILKVSGYALTPGNQRAACRAGLRAQKTLPVRRESTCTQTERQEAPKESASVGTGCTLECNDQAVQVGGALFDDVAADSISDLPRTFRGSVNGSPVVCDPLPESLRRIMVDSFVEHEEALRRCAKETCRESYMKPRGAFQVHVSMHASSMGQLPARMSVARFEVVDSSTRAPLMAVDKVADAVSEL